MLEKENSLFKYFIIVVSLIISAVNDINCQTICDLNFAEAIKKECPLCITKDNILTDHCDTLKRLVVSNRNIQSIEGIYKFKNLLYLDCSENSLAELSILPESLEFLNCENNQISNLPLLPNNLKELLTNKTNINCIPNKPSSLNRLSSNLFQCNLLNNNKLSSGEIITDICGNNYNTVVIGAQTWFAENLRTCKYKNGDNIPNVPLSANWSSLTSGAYTILGNNNSYETLFGKLYNWYSVNDQRGLCPVGWKIPDTTDWNILIKHLGGYDVAGGKMKFNKYWDNPNNGATNSSGFTAIPGGFRNEPGSYGGIGLSDFSFGWFWGYWWSSNDSLNSNNAYNYVIGSASGRIGERLFSKKNGFSVRCIKDVKIEVYTNPPERIIPCEQYNLCGGITTTNGLVVKEKGIVWSQLPNINLINNGIKVPVGSGIDPFCFNLSVQTSAIYYYRAYAISTTNDISYGTEYSFTVPASCCLSETEILKVPLYKDIVDNICKNLQDSSIGIYSAQYNGQLVYFAFHSNYNYFVVTDCKGEVLYATDEFPYDYKKRQDYLRGFKDVKLIDSCPGGKSLCYKPSNNCPIGVCQAIFSNGCGCDGVFYDSPCKAECAFVSYTTNSCSTPCNPDLCDKNSWLYKVVDSLLKQNYVIVELLMSGNYYNISYYNKSSPPFLDGPFYVSTLNCQGKLLQHCNTTLRGRRCDFFMPFTQDPFPGNSFKIDTIVKSLSSWEDFKCDKLQCGSVRYGNTETGKATFNQYLCSYNLMGGKEIIYEFDKKANQSAVFHLSDVIRDLDLFVLSKNDEDFCVKHSSKDGQSYDNIFLEASVPAGTYYVVVDGFNNNSSAYKLTVECDKPEGILDCNKAKSINCNESLSGNTSLDGISMNQFYGSSSSVFYDGKEVIYKLIAPFDGVIDILLENLNSDLDLFVFDDCGNKLNPLEFSIEANKEEEAILLSVLKGKTYFIVIDSRFEMEGNFTLSITCTDCTCNNPPCVPPPPLICQDKIQLFCNEPKLGDTRTSNYQRIKQYGCGGVTKGKELLYYFELNSAQKVDIFIRNILPGNNLKLIVLDSCNPYTAKCLASGNKSNESNEAIRLNLAKGVYYIYVDGYLDKDASSFEIEIKCKEISCEKNPITLSFDTTNINCSYNIEVKPKDGVPPYTYKWSNGMTTSKLTGVPPGKYIVTVTDKKLCSKVDSVLVNSSCKPDCGTTIKGNTFFGKSNYYKYECSYHKMDGNEIIYEFDNPSTQNVVITLTDLVQDLDLFLLEYVTPMNPDRCVKSSTRTDGSYESIFVENLPKGKYYIVVEGYNKRESSFTLKIDCPKPRGFLDCANAQNVECNNTYSGDTKLGKANNNYYGSDSPVYYNGKELVYKFVAPQGAAEVIAFLENLTSDVDFFVVDNCGNPVSSFSASTESNLSDEAILFYPVAGRTYYFVVDSPEGLEGSYNLRLECTGTCPGCPPSPPFNCNKKTLLLCNTPLADNNFNGDSRNKAYCTGVALGKEKLYYFEIKTAQEVEIILSNIPKGKSLNIYLLNKCEPSGNCLAVGNKSSDSEDVIIKNLAAGIYYIWVDGFKASDESTYTIEVRCKDIDCSTDPISLAGNIIPVSCGINDLKVTVVKGGIPPFTYKWSTGETTDVLKNAKAGTYTVTVTDKRFCNEEFSFNVPVLPPLTLSSIVTISNCKYNITINPSGGKPPYSYLWKDGATTNPRTNLPAGTYAVTVSDAANCKKDTSFVLAPLEINITQKIDSADCGKANGRIEVVTSSKIKSAVWQDNAPNSLVRENLKADEYTLTLTDVNGCIKTIDFEVGEKNNCSCTIYSTINPKDPANQFFHIECWTKDCPNKPNSCLEIIELYIYNRWGNLVYKDSDYKNTWDAQGLPDGVYYYQFKRSSGTKFEKGSIVVKRSN